MKCPKCGQETININDKEVCTECGTVAEAAQTPKDQIVQAIGEKRKEVTATAVEKAPQAPPSTVQLAPKVEESVPETVTPPQESLPPKSGFDPVVPSTPPKPPWPSAPTPSTPPQPPQKNENQEQPDTALGQQPVKEQTAEVPDFPSPDNRGPVEEKNEPVISNVNPDPQPEEPYETGIPDFPADQKPAEAEDASQENPTPAATVEQPSAQPTVEAQPGERVIPVPKHEGESEKPTAQKVDYSYLEKPQAFNSASGADEDKAVYPSREIGPIVAKIGLWGLLTLILVGGGAFFYFNYEAVMNFINGIIATVVELMAGALQ